nr:MAG TPA: YoaP-like protein [Caudoviricetes sp.]
MDFQYFVSIKSPKIRPNHPTPYRNFAVFLYFPKSKSPNLNRVVGSIYDFVVN